MLTSDPLLISCLRTAPRKQQRAQPGQIPIHTEKLTFWLEMLFEVAYAVLTRDKHHNDDSNQSVDQQLQGLFQSVLKIVEH